MPGVGCVSGTALNVREVPAGVSIRVEPSPQKRAHTPSEHSRVVINRADRADRTVTINEGNNSYHGYSSQHSHSPIPAAQSTAVVEARTLSAQDHASSLTFSSPAARELVWLQDEYRAYRSEMRAKVEVKPYIIPVHLLSRWLKELIKVLCLS